MKTSKPLPQIWFDYENQAWVENGFYVRCNHPVSLNCRCYGKLHEFEVAPVENCQENDRLTIE